jgi:8-hydroxy-5-deazaflavin:NADPH oxidoreductase
MTYSIIGSGAIGSALAKQFAKAGISVRVANTRGPHSIQPLAEKFGPSIVPSELAEALKADLVILAIPFSSAREVVSQEKDWAGRILVDATNAIDFPAFTPTDLGGKPSTTVVAESAPDASVVKGFNHLGANILARDADDGRNYDARTQFISGSSEHSKTIVKDLMEKMGFAVVDLGTIGGGGLLHQFGGPLSALSLVSQDIDFNSPHGPDLVTR